MTVAPLVIVRNPKHPTEAPTSPTVNVMPFAAPTRARRSFPMLFIAIVCLPLVTCAVYLWGFAADRYESGFSFSVRSASQTTPQNSAMASMMGAGGASSDAGVLADFITSREMPERLTHSGLDLAGMMSMHAGKDPLFSLRDPDDPEALARYWADNVSAVRDPQTGIVRVEVQAFTADDAKTVATSVMEQTRQLVDELSSQSKDDTMRSSEAEVSRAEKERDAARTALTDFRVSNAIVDPETSLTGRVSTIDQLRSELDKEMLARADIAANARSNDPRLAQADVRIKNLNTLIGQRTAEFGDDTGYARVASRYEDLMARAEFSEITLRNAMTVRDGARKEADMRAAYLVPHVLPHRPYSPGAPHRVMIMCIAAAFLLGAWLLSRLVISAIREHA